MSRGHTSSQKDEVVASIMLSRIRTALAMLYVGVICSIARILSSAVRSSQAIGTQYTTNQKRTERLFRPFITERSSHISKPTLPARLGVSSPDWTPSRNVHRDETDRLGKNDVWEDQTPVGKVLSDIPHCGTSGRGVSRYVCTVASRTIRPLRVRGARIGIGQAQGNPV